MGDDEDTSNPQPAAGDDVILETCIPDELLGHLRAVLYRNLVSSAS